MLVGGEHFVKMDGSTEDDSRDLSALKEQAKAVRAFYDAADRLLTLEEHKSDQATIVFEALQELSQVVEQAKNSCSDEFVRSLANAAQEYFRRVALLQRDNLDSLIDADTNDPES